MQVSLLCDRRGNRAVLWLSGFFEKFATRSPVHDPSSWKFFSSQSEKRRNISLPPARGQQGSFVSTSDGRDWRLWKGTDSFSRRHILRLVWPSLSA